MFQILQTKIYKLKKRKAKGKPNSNKDIPKSGEVNNIAGTKPIKALINAVKTNDTIISLIFMGAIKRLVKLIIEDIISGKIAKEVLVEMFNTKQDPEKIIDQKGLKQVTDTSEIEIIVDEVIKENQKMVDQYLSGKDKLLGFFVGQCMKKSKGKANPKILNDILKEKLSKKN